MNFYETLYIVNPNLPEESYGEVLSKFNTLVEKNKGVLIRVEEWGKRSLAYQVKKFDKGYFVLLKYCGGADTTMELERGLRLDDRTVKFQTIKLSSQADPEELKRREAETKGTPAVEEAESTVGESDSAEEIDSEENREEEDGL
jgi:small subunit ribosomal protein S6